MITFDVKLKGKEPEIYVKIPMGDYLLDDDQLASAKQVIEGIQNLCGRSYEYRLFINDEKPSNTRELIDIVEKYRSLYILSLLDGVLEKVKPLNDPYVSEIIEKVEPLIKQTKSRLNDFERWRY